MSKISSTVDSLTRKILIDLLLYALHWKSLINYTNRDRSLCSVLSLVRKIFTRSIRLCFALLEKSIAIDVHISDFYLRVFVLDYPL